MSFLSCEEMLAAARSQKITLAEAVLRSCLLYTSVVADNFYNASPVVLDRVKQITGKDFRFYNADMTKHEDVEKIFTECPDITAVIQFAAYKAVGESVSKPIEYYYNNLNCTLVILDVMRKHNCHNFVFSSSATVYGDPASVPITEDFPVGATTNPYGTTKAFTERILTDEMCIRDSGGAVQSGQLHHHRHPEHPHQHGGGCRASRMQKRPAPTRRLHLPRRKSCLLYTSRCV